MEQDVFKRYEKKYMITMANILSAISILTHHVII